MSTKPTHEAFVVAGDGEVARWTRIGVGFQKNGGMTILSDVLPQGRLVVRPVKESTSSTGGAK